MAKKKYSTVEENLSRRKYYNGTRPVATTSMGMGPVYIDTGDGKKADTYTPSTVHTFNLKGNSSAANNTSSSAPAVPILDTSNKPTYTPQNNFNYTSQYEYTPFEWQSNYQPSTFNAPSESDYMKGNYDVGDFNSNWSDKLNSLYNEIAGRGKFSYNQAEDPLYQQYAEMYRKNAQLAMNDTMAKASALTGGYGSSYAETAGQSMYNQQMDNLNERALDLYDRALNAWALEGNELNQRFNLAGQMYNNDYNLWRAQMQDAQYRQQFDYNRYLNDKNFAWNQYQYTDQMNYQRDQDAYNRARAAYEYDQGMRYQLDVDAYNRAMDAYKMNTDEARYAYETANQDYWNTANYNLDIYDRNNDNYWRNIENEWRAKEFDNDNYWKQQEFDWNKETYNRDDAFRYDQLGYQDKWNQQDLDYNYARLGEDSRQFDAGLGLDYAQLGEQRRQYDLSRGDQNYWNTADDRYRYAQLGEQQRQYNMNYGLDAFNAGYDPATGTYSQANQQRYNDDLALQYAKLGLNPDGSLNAIGQMERDKIAAKQAEAEQKAIEEKKKASGKTGNYYNDDLTYENVTNWIDSEGGDYSHVLTAAQYAKANAALKKQYPTYKKYLASQIDRRALNKG